MAKVVNLFGGPGVGKTVVAAGLFYEMKKLNYNVELVKEFATDLVYENRLDILDTDQLFILANQNRNLMVKAFNDKLDFVIMESPILLSNIYFNELSIYDKDLFNDFNLNLFNKYDNENFHIQRNTKYKFDMIGRIHSEYESVMIDVNILKYLRHNNIEFNSIKNDDETINEILKILAKK